MNKFFNSLMYWASFISRLFLLIMFANFLGESPTKVTLTEKSGFLAVFIALAVSIEITLRQKERGV